MKKQLRFHLLAVVLVALLISVPFFFSQLDTYGDSAVGSDDWSMYKHDPQRTGYSSSTAPSTSELKWFYNTTVEVLSPPVVADGRVIVGVYDGTVLALNSTTGEKLWLYDTDAGDKILFHSAVIDSGRVYINTRDVLYCLNSSTGELLWYFGAGFNTYSSLVISGRVFFGYIQ